MAATLPDGSIVSLATTIASAKTIATLSNASPAVAGSTAHGFSNGDLVVVASGWGRLNQRVVKVASSLTDSFAMADIDTSSTTYFPAGSGTGTASKITAWTQISQILGFSTSGGEQQFTNFSYLEDNFERQLPTVTSAQSLQMQLADDASLAGYVALKAASESKAVTPLRLTLPSGAVILYNGIVSLNETPSLSKGNVMTVTATFSLQNRPVRY